MHGGDDCAHCFLLSLNHCVLKLIVMIITTQKNNTTEHNCLIAIHFTLTYSNQPKVVNSSYSYLYQHVCALNCLTTRGEA